MRRELVGLLEGGGGWSGLCVDGRKELNGDAAVAVRQILDAGDLAEVLEIVRIAGKVIGNRDEEAHAFAIGFVFGEEVNAVAGDVFGSGGLLEVGVVRIGRAHFEGLADANAAAAPTFIPFNVQHIDMRTQKQISGPAMCRNKYDAVAET